MARRTASDLLTRNWTLKLAAILLAILLWAIVRAQSPMRVTLRDVPVQVAMQDPGWVLAEPPAPATVTVVASGSLRDLVRVRSERPRIIVPVERVLDSTEVRVLQPRWVQIDGNVDVRIDDVRPGTVRLSFEELTTRLVPLAITLRGELPAGLELVEPPRLDPPAVRVSGPGRRLEDLHTVGLAPIQLDQVGQSMTVSVPVDTAGLDGLLVSPSEVRVVLRVASSP